MIKQKGVLRAARLRLTVCSAGSVEMTWLGLVSQTLFFLNQASRHNRSREVILPVSSPQWDHTWSIGSSLGLPSIRKTLRHGNESSGGHQRGGGCSTWKVRRGGEACSHCKGRWWGALTALFSYLLGVEEMQWREPNSSQSCTWQDKVWLHTRWDTWNL